MNGKMSAGSIALAIATVHLIASLLVNSYVSSHVGAVAGRAVTDTIKQVIESPAAVPGTDQGQSFNQAASANSAFIRNWRIPLAIVNLPAAPVFRAIATRLRHDNFQKVQSRQMTPESFLFRLRFVSYASMVLNSMVLGVVLYLGIMAIKRRRIA